MNRALLLTVLTNLALCSIAHTQTTGTNQAKPTPPKAARKKAPDPKAERLVRERKEQAQSLLIALATDAGSYKDQKRRARIQVRIADILWDVDQERARSMR